MNEISHDGQQMPDFYKTNYTNFLGYNLKNQNTDDTQNHQSTAVSNYGPADFYQNQANLSTKIELMDS